MSRETQSGEGFEKRLAAWLWGEGYLVQRQVPVQTGADFGRKVFDILLHPRAREPVLVSCKWQDVGGTADQKVPYEILVCIAARKATGWRVFIVIGGDGWHIGDKALYTSDRIAKYMPSAGEVRVLTELQFKELAKDGLL